MTAPATAAAVEVRQIPVADLVPTPDNPRVIRPDDPSLADLAESVRGAGVRIPVHARPHPTQEGKLELLVGARRHFAAIKAGLETIPTIVQDLDDAEAFKLSFLENYDREDLTPIEQGRAAAILLARNGGDVDAAAAIMGHSRKWVRQVARVQSLSVSWQQAIANPRHGAASLGIAHLVLIARLQSDVQDAILASAGAGQSFWNKLSVAELDHWLNDHWLRLLAKATWDRADATLVPEAGPCSQCIKRSSRQAELFHDSLPDAEAAKHDRCLDGACWCRKLAAGLKAKAKALRKKHGKVLLVYGEYNDHAADGATEDELRAGGLKGIERTYNYQDCKASDPRAIAALICTGAKAGKTRYVRSYLGADKERQASTKPASLAALREQLGDRRHAHAIEAAMQAVAEAPAPQANVVLGLLATFGAMPSDDTPNADPAAWRETYDRHAAAELGGLTAALWPDVLEAISDAYWKGQEWPVTADLAGLLGIDTDAILSAATAAIPEPPEWAALKSDGTPKAAAKKAKKPKTP